MDSFIYSLPMPEEKEPKLDAPEEVASESSDESAGVSAEVSLAEIHAEGAALVATEEAGEIAPEEEESEPAKREKKRKVRRFNPHETARVDSLAGVPLATFMQRFIAYAFDFLIVCIVSSVFATLITYLAVEVFHLRPQLHQQTGVVVAGHADPEMEKMIEFVQVIIVLLYFGPSVWLTNGLTLGKRLMKIRVVSLTHERITLWQSCERALGYGASALEGFFGFFQFFIYPNRTCVHDRIAETIVVQDARVKKEKSVKATKSK